jgi:hypothetical protein
MISLFATEELETMKLTPGSRWKSTVCDTEVVVVRSAGEGGSLLCGGAPMAPVAEARSSKGTIPEGHAGGSLMGKRYGDDENGLEVMCTKPGAGSLTVVGRALVMREAKRLPSSD